MINQKIKDLIEESEIDSGEALLYLFRLWAGIQPTCISPETVRKVNFLKIVEQDLENGILTWNMDLFSSPQAVKADSSWVELYRDKFRQIRPSAIGSRTGVYGKMDKFLKENPTVTKEQILAATEIYVNELISTGNGQYVMDADNFISKQDLDRTKRSKLQTYIEILDTKGYNLIGERNHSQNLL